MNLSFLYLVFGLLAWGYLVQNLTLAIGLLLVFALVQSSWWRWTISVKQLHRWGDVSSFLVVLLLLQTYVLQPVEQPMFVLLNCLPVIFAPVLLAQFLSRQTEIPLSTLFYALRKKHRDDNKSIDFTLPYAAICIVSAGAENVADHRYFALATAFFVMVSGFNRPKHHRFLVWFAIVLCAAIVSFFGQKGLRQLHIFVEQQSIRLLSNWQVDPFKDQTAIGDLGELKLSNQIEFRVKADGQILLHQASYDRYLGRTWVASKRVFRAEQAIKTDPQTLKLKRLEVLQQTIDQTILALPDGTVEIQGLDDAVLQYSELGAVKAEMPAKNMNYQVLYTGKRLGKPSRYDLQLPPQHMDWLKQFYQQLKLENLPPKVIAERIKDYFQANFFYSLYLGKEANPDLALKNFMLKTKSGHCEYFAAATVLLLRQSDIPARLATGYSVSEYLPEYDLYLVRRRDAHAWAIAYIDGIWQPVDSTPAQWRQMETDNADNLWQTLTDAWSNSLFLLKQWQITEQQLLQLKFSALTLILLYLAIRFIHSKRTTKPQKTAPAYAGLDSEFYLLEQRLRNTAKARLDNESLQQWVNRLNSPELIQLCQLHYQLRFDPNGLTTEQRKQLRQRVQKFNL